MSFATRAKRPAPQPRFGLPCPVSTLLESLVASERKALEKMLEDREEWKHSVLHQAILDEGHTMRRDALEKHRRRECRCFS